MQSWTRRSFLVVVGGGLAACTSSPQIESPRDTIDRQVDEALNELYASVPGASSSASCTRAVAAPRYPASGCTTQPSSTRSLGLPG